MLVELAQTTTSDGLRLDGAFWPAQGAARLSVAGIGLVHGTGSNFYSSTLLTECCQMFASLGCSVLSINTRGHDGISTAATSRGGRRLGAAYEVVDDCRHDLAAWSSWLCERVAGPIAWLGHSLGAVKCLYANALEPDPRVARLLALSPPRLSYTWFCSNPEREAFLQDFQRAEELVVAGRGQTLLEVRVPLSMVIAASGYVEKYGPEERYDYFPLLRRFSIPVLFAFGSVEVRDNLAFRQAPDEIASLQSRYPHLSVEVIPEADHVYTGQRAVLLERLVRWLSQSPV